MENTVKKSARSFTFVKNIAYAIPAKKPVYAGTLNSLILCAAFYARKANVEYYVAPRNMAWQAFPVKASEAIFDGFKIMPNGDILKANFSTPTA